MIESKLNQLISKLPKAELHIHVEGSLEPELMLRIAQRNKIRLKYKSVEDIKKAYDFKNLQDFLNIYYSGASVLLTEQDFYDMTWAYLVKAHSHNITHTEIFFDPQTHTERGISITTVIEGIHSALINAKQEFGITSEMIMCFLRHLDEKSAIKTLKQSLLYKDWIIAVGLDSSEVGNPPSKFNNVFARAKEYGFLTVAHAGEEGPESYISEALDLLNVSRIDHGNRSMENPRLLKRLIDLQIPLTLCPLSNLKLQVTPDLTKHPLKKMLDMGLLVTVNSDDPAYFGGYINENYSAIAKALNLSTIEIKKLAVNSIKASFMSEDKKNNIIQSINSFAD